MKIKTIFAASLLATGVAFADTAAVDTEYVIGVLPVALAKDQQEIILNIPWIEAGQSSEGVAVTNLVKTAGLAENDSLLWYDTANSKYQSWRIVNNAWKPTATVKSRSLPLAISATTNSLNRGQALILNRTGTVATNIYVVGQYATGSGSSTIAAGTPNAPVYTLIAPPSVDSTTDLSAKLTSEAVDGDEVTFMKDGQIKSYSYNGTNWGTKRLDEEQTPPRPVFTPVSAGDMTLPAGTGLYYKRCGDSFTVNW